MAGYCPDSCCPYTCHDHCCESACCNDNCCESPCCSSCCDGDEVGCCEQTACFENWCDYIAANEPSPSTCCPCVNVLVGTSLSTCGGIYHVCGEGQVCCDELECNPTIDCEFMGNGYACYLQGYIDGLEGGSCPSGYHCASENCDDGEWGTLCYDMGHENGCIECGCDEGEVCCNSELCGCTGACPEGWGCAKADCDDGGIGSNCYDTGYMDGLDAGATGDCPSGQECCDECCDGSCSTGCSADCYVAGLEAGYDIGYEAGRDQAFLEICTFCPTCSLC